MKLDTFLKPGAIAIIGASLDPNKLGWQVLNNLISGGYRGEIYPVNLKASNILGLKTYPTVKQIKNKIDLAVIVLPAKLVSEEVKNCAEVEIKNLIIISAGFSESDEKGEALEKELIDIANKWKLNILGPNCLGFVNTKENLNLTFAKSRSRPGNVAFLSQSGALGSAVLDWVANKPYGLSHFVSLGNKAILNENDFFEALIHDENSTLVIAYLEEIEDGESFMTIVSRLSKIKPVAILKAGRTKSGSEAAHSHTGSFTGTHEAVIAGLMRSGAIILDNPEQMFDLIHLAAGRNWTFHNQRLFIISNSGGPLVLAADHAEQIGFKLGEFDSAAFQTLKKVLPSNVHVTNPLDLIGDANHDRYRAAIEVVLADPTCDNLLVLLAPQSALEIEKTAEVIIAETKKYPHKTIFTSFMGGELLNRAKALLATHDIPNFSFPERAITVLAKLVHNREEVKDLREYSAKKSTVLHSKGQKGQQLDYLHAFKILKEFKIPTVQTVKIDRPSDLNRLSYPAVLKIVGPQLLHKTEHKSVALHLKTLQEANEAFKNFAGLLRQEDNYCVAQPMIKGELELILGFKRDRSFGPLIVVGLGGIYTEILNDITVSVSDINSTEALACLKRLKIYRILQGARAQHFDINALIDIMLKVAAIAHEHPEISEMDVNPLFLLHSGLLAVDVRIIL
ncbi:MAG: acetate--CoA ligase family protein [Bdellovibrio sp.]|nr:acetate--CoA ligase family protein [Bdellovibrio sp.]